MLPHPSPLRLASHNLFSYTWPTCSASLAFAQGPGWLKHPQIADLPVAWDYRGRQSPSHKHVLKPTIVLFRCWESNPQCSDYNASALTTEPRSPDLFNPVRLLDIYLGLYLNAPLTRAKIFDFESRFGFFHPSSLPFEIIWHDL